MPDAGLNRALRGAEGTFPASVSLGSRVAWIESEVQDWIDARIAAR